MMATANALIGFGALPVVVAGCALFGLSMSGWMLPLTLSARTGSQGQLALPRDSLPPIWRRR